MKTSPVTRARHAALVALALSIASIGAMPVQAAILEKKPLPGSEQPYDCLSRQEVKYEMRQLGLSHISVSRTDERYIYKVVALGEPSKKEALADGQPSDNADSLLVEKQNPDKIRYVLLYDACDQRVIRQISPPLEAL